MSQRIEYIDAMRGFLILLVVFAHTETFSIFNFAHETMIGHLLQCIMMPLFFFISGFVAHRENQQWSMRYFFQKILKKTRQLLTPTIVFGILYTIVVLRLTFFDFLAEPAKEGYWFTLVLLEILVVYYLIDLIVFLAKKREDNKVVSIILVIISVLAFLFKLPLKTIPVLNLIGNVTSLHYTCLYLQYFTLGVLAAAWNDTTEKILSSRFTTTSIVILFAVVFYLRFSILVKLAPSGLVFTVADTFLEAISGYLGVVMIFGLFRRSSDIFSADRRLGKILQSVGKRTLDIYMLHYFILQPIPGLGQFFINDPNIILELLCVGGITLSITFVCLIISDVIRLSDFLAHWLFGIEYKKSQALL